MPKQLNELVITTSENGGDIGIVFKLDCPPKDIRIIMAPLVVQHDYFLVCLTKGSEGYRLFLRVNNTEDNRNIIDNITEIYQRFDIPNIKSTKVTYLYDLYHLICNMEETDKYASNAIKLEQSLYDNFIALVQDCLSKKTNI